MNRLLLLINRCFKKILTYLKKIKGYLPPQKPIIIQSSKKPITDIIPVVNQFPKESKLDFIEHNTSITELRDIVVYLDSKLELEKETRKSSLIKGLYDALTKARVRLKYIESLSSLDSEFERILSEQKRLASKQNRFQPYEVIDLGPLKSAELDIIEKGFVENSILYQIANSESEELAEILASLEISNYFSDNEDESLDDLVVNDELINPIPIKEVNIIQSNQKIDTQLIINYLKAFNIHFIHHVTEKSNINSIKRLGLFSRKKLDNKGISYVNNVADSTSTSLDRKYSKEDYVRLSFCEATPMFHKKKYLQSNIIFKVPIECLLEVEFEFSNMNGTDNRVKFGRTLEFLTNQVKVLKAAKGNFFDLQGDDKKYYQAEILVKEHLPAKFLTETIPF